MTCPACSAKEGSQLQQHGDLVTFEGIILEVKRTHLSVVVDAEHADALDDLGAGARLSAWTARQQHDLQLACSHILRRSRVTPFQQALCAYAAALRWRVDQRLSSTTTQRELSAIEGLSDLQLGQAALCARLAIVGNVQLATAPNTWAR